MPHLNKKICTIICFRSYEVLLGMYTYCVYVSFGKSSIKYIVQLVFCGEEGEQHDTRLTGTFLWAASLILILPRHHLFPFVKKEAMMPRICVFDVNETLLDLRALDSYFVRVNRHTYVPQPQRYRA
jgi:hypothetical protein